MAVRDIEAIIFDCIGVLYKTNGSLFHRPQLNRELVNYINSDLKPHYKIGLLSNIDRQWMTSFLLKHELESLFDAVVVSGDSGVAKPSVVIYQEMSEKIGVNTDVCMMIDDLQENCTGAEKAGMKSHLYRSNEMLFEELE